MQHTLPAQTPPAASAAWTSVTVEEAVSPNSVWSVVATIAQTPDTDPQHPVARDIVFTSALGSGYYRLTWTNAVPASAGPGDVMFDAAWMPSIAEVTALAWTRAVDANGNFGTWKTERLAQLSEIIRIATLSVTAKVGGTIPESLYDFARMVIARGAAVEIERSFFPNEITPDSGAYKAQLAQYQTDLSQLAEDVESAANDPTEGFGTDVAAALPSVSGPPPTCWDW